MVWLIVQRHDARALPPTFAAYAGAGFRKDKLKRSAE
jgi:hypothetical protein